MCHVLLLGSCSIIIITQDVQAIEPVLTVRGIAEAAEEKIAVEIT